MTIRYLIDKSAFARYSEPGVRAAIDPLDRAGLLAVCGAVELEVLHSARSKADAERIRDEAWDDEQRSTEEPERAVDRIGSRRALSGDGQRDATDRRARLPAQQLRAER